MKSVILATALFASLHAFPQAPTFAFAKQFGGVNPGNGDDAAVSVVYGTDGSIYVAGSFFGLFDMDPGSTTASVSSAGDRDIYVVKLNSLGDFIWGNALAETVPTNHERWWWLPTAT
ncbi:MAG: hypothetical protein IPJ85_12505 [Flavobacteriales bacterium]|nr:hypothetical protein [Flavobacteriales bacterium]